MDIATRKKLKDVLIAFVILIIPIGYLFAVTYAFKVHSETMDDLIFVEDHEVIKNGLEDLDRALKIVPWSSAIKDSKDKLYTKLGEYRIVLNRALKTDSYGQAAMMYEYLNQPDSAKIYYQQILIESNPDQILKEEGNIFNQHSIQRSIALHYTFLEDSIKANEYLKELSEDMDIEQQKALLRFDFYIENYQSGGYMDFLHGETIFMQNDTLTKGYNTDSLLIANRIMYQSKSFEEDTAKFEFKLVFKEKAEKIGFRQTMN